MKSSWKKKLIDKAQEAPDTVFIASDEASLYLQATTQAVGAPVGQTPCIRAAPSREKVCFYGSLNLHTGEQVVTRTDTMNAYASSDHFQAILDRYPDQPVVLFWDRAPWHRGASVSAILDQHPRLEIWKLPGAAPDLNPQEQVWKAARRAVSHNHQIPRLPALADRFEAYLRDNTFHCALLDRYGYNAICPMFK